MSNIVATIQTLNNNNNNTYYIQENEQNKLKGLVWGAGGSVLGSMALVMTAATICSLIGVTFVSGAVSAAGSSLPKEFTNGLPERSTVIGAIVVGSAFTAFVDWCAVKFSGFCLNKSIYHLGPKFQIHEIKLPKTRVLEV